MSKIVARMEKMKTGNLEGIQRHNQRETDNHSNKDIDTERSYLNYDLVNQKSINYRKQIHKIINKQRVSKRAVRKDAVLVDEWIITSDKPFFETADSKKFFQDSLAYFSERCGSKNIVYATVHLDETTPHMHLGIVPMYENRLSSKQMFSRQSLKEIQDELPCYLQKKGHKIERGIKGSEQKHLTVEEYKENQQAIKKMSQVIQSQKNELILVDRQISSQQQAMTNELVQIWETEWAVTKDELPSFEMTYEVYDITENELKVVSVDEHTPKDYKMNFREIIGLFKEKFTQLKEYIALKWQNLTDKAIELDINRNHLEEREKRLEGKLERLDVEIENKTIQSEQLTTLIDSKTKYVERLADISELSMMTPTYLKASKLNKDVWIVPKEQWEAKHVSANSVSDMLSIKDTFTYAESMIRRQSQESISKWELESENRKLKHENRELSEDYIILHNGFVRLLNNNCLSETEIKSVLNTKVLERMGFEPEQRSYEKQKGLDDFSRGL